MKNVLRNCFVFTVTLLGVMCVFAVPNPPSPSTAKTAATTAITPPGMSIDGGIAILQLLGLFLGVYVVFKYQLKRKDLI